MNKKQLPNMERKNRFWGSFWGSLTKLVIILTIIGGIIGINTYCKNLVLPGRIYLSIWETGKEIPLNRDYMVVPSINEIKAKEPTSLRFTLTQNNVNSPQITKIFVTFPPEAEVKPIAYEGWNWKRNNDVEITYYLDYKEIPAKGGLYNLPAFEVKFKEVKLLPFKYSIIGNKINPIKRKFIIKPELKYQDSSGRLFYGNVFDNSARTTVSGVNTASPSVVEWRFDNTTTNNAVTPDVVKYRNRIEFVTELGVVYVGMPKELLEKAGYTELMQRGYRQEGNEEWITYLNWTTKEPDDLVTFYIVDGKVKGWKVD